MVNSEQKKSIEEVHKIGDVIFVKKKKILVIETISKS